MVTYVPVWAWVEGLGEFCSVWGVLVPAGCAPDLPVANLPIRQAIKKKKTKTIKAVLKITFIILSFLFSMQCVQHRTFPFFAATRTGRCTSHSLIVFVRQRRKQMEALGSTTRFG
jgi:hypothetical protein